MDEGRRVGVALCSCQKSILCPPPQFFLTISGSQRNLVGFPRVDVAGRLESPYFKLKTYVGSSLFSQSVF
jgi:hypothetical protein